jgi:hypothetical protein
MLEALIRQFKRFKQANRGVSNVIVIMLSLVLLVVIVSNVILWSYQMNQFDLERMQETINIANVTRVTRSSWFTAQKEYTISVGSQLSGSYTDTKVLDDSYETFREEKTQIFNPNSYVLNGSTKYVSGDIQNLTSNDNTYMTFRSYPNYETRYQESLGASPTTSTTYQDKVSIVFTPQITADFIIVATAEVQGSSASYQAKARLTINSSTYQELLYRVKDTTDWYPFCGLKRIILNENASYTISIQFCTNNAAATASIRNARLVFISLQSAYAESEGLSTTSSTSWQDKTILSFTPQSAGDYLIIATANYRGSQTNRDTNIQLIQDDTIVHIDTIGRPGSGTTANYYTFGVMRKVTLNATPHTFKIQYCSSGTPGIAGINYAHIIAIQLDQLDSNHYAEDEGESIPAASNTWYDKITNSYTADAGSHLLMGSIAYKSGSTSSSVELDFQTESTSRQSPLVEHRDATTYESAFFMSMQTLTAGGKTDRIRWRGESTSARVKNARLISCKLPALTQTAEVEFIGNSNIQNWTKLEWTTDLAFTTANVTTTLQLYNYQTSQYPTSGDGYMSDIVGLPDLTENQTITTNPTDYRDSSDKWRMKIKGVKTTDTQFKLNIDWAESKVTTSDIYRLGISNDFAIDLSKYPLDHVDGVELFIRYNATEAAEKWFLEAYNWTALDFSNAGFNSTKGNSPLLGEWNEYALSISENWRSYVRDDGILRIRFFDEGLNTNQTIVGIDFFGVRAIIDGARFDLKNAGPVTAHVISIWIVNLTAHQRYDANIFINAGEETVYVRADVTLPENSFIAKIVTERGNIAIFAAD